MLKLQDKPHSFDFFWALRQLHALDRSLNLGASLRPREDRIRLMQMPSLVHPASTLTNFVPPTEESPGQLTVSFLGLFGPNGAMPLHVTEYALDRQKANDHTLVAFLNVFQHRLLSLFFRAWSVHQKTADMDRPDQEQFTRYIGSFIGRGMPSMRNRDEVSDVAKLYFSGRLSCQTRNAEGLSAILGEYFGIKVRVEPFTGQWLKVPAADACRVGKSRATGLLGQNVIVGSRVWQCQTKFRLRFGPMFLADLLRLLPNKDSFLRLKTWVRNYIGDEFFWDAQYVLLAKEVPQTQLGGAYLGWTTWITTRKPTEDAEDLVLDPSLS